MSENTATQEQNETESISARKKRSQEKFELACTLIRDRLAGGEWVSSRTIHAELGEQVAEGMFGRVKKELAIEHRRIRGEERVEYQWRLPAPEPAPATTKRSRRK